MTLNANKMNGNFSAIKQLLRSLLLPSIPLGPGFQLCKNDTPDKN